MPADTVHEMVESAKPKAKAGPVYLTDRMIERIKPPADNKRPSKSGKSTTNARKTISDNSPRGLQLRITPDGTKSWSLMFTIAGAGPNGDRGPNCRMSLGQYPHVSLAAARKKASELLEIANRGRDPRAVKSEEIKQANERAFAVVCNNFIERYAKKKIKSWARTKRILEDYVLKEWGHLQVDEITRGMAHALLDKIENSKPVAKPPRLSKAKRKTPDPPTQRPAPDKMYKTVPIEVRKQLSRLFNWAMDRDLVTANPLARIEREEEHVKRARVLSMEELKRVWDAADKLGYPFGPFVKLLILTGQRRVEIASLQRSWLQPTFFEIPAAHYKTKRIQLVPLSKPASKIIESLPVWNEGNFVLSTTSGQRPISGYSKTKRRLDKLSGVEDWTYHDLRRSAASHMAELGVHGDHVERVLGHAIGDVASVYNQYDYRKEKLAALELWGSKWTS